MEQIKLSAPQKIFLTELDTKFRAFVGGLGSGKTFVGCLDLLLFAAEHPGLTQGYFAPTYTDIRDTFWPTVEEAGEMIGFDVTVKVSDKEVFLHRNGAFYGKIICRSMNDPGSIVGFKIARALVDEIDILPVDKALTAWRKIIARLRLVIPGVVNGVGVTTTPEGFKFVYEMFMRSPGADYSMVQASTEENAAHLPEDYIPSLRASYPDELVAAYLDGNFVNLTSGTVYRQYNRLRCRSYDEIEDDDVLHIGQDFNVGHMASVIWVERENGWHAVAELKDLQDTPHLIEVLQEKYPGHKIYIYPDASGASRKTVNASETDLKLLRMAGFVIRAFPKNPPVKDRVLAVNNAWEKGQIWLNDKACPTFAEAQEQQAYDRNGQPEKTPTSGFDHHNDAGGYFVSYTLPVRRPKVDAPWRSSAPTDLTLEAISETQIRLNVDMVEWANAKARKKKQDQF